MCVAVHVHCMSYTCSPYFILVQNQLEHILCARLSSVSFDNLVCALEIHIIVHIVDADEGGGYIFGKIIL